MKYTHLRERKLLKLILKTHIKKFPKNHKAFKMLLKSKERKIVCLICGDEHFVRICPKKIVKSNPKKESLTSSENNKISTIIHNKNVKNYTSHSLSISDLQYVNIFVDNESKSALLNSGAIILVLNKQTLTK